MRRTKSIRHSSQSLSPQKQSFFFSHSGSTSVSLWARAPPIAQYCPNDVTKLNNRLNGKNKIRLLTPPAIVGTEKSLL